MINGYRTQRVTLAAVILLLLLFADMGFASQKYVVQRGDTLYEIAQKFDVSIAAIQNANNIRNANVIRNGQVLTIPTKPAADSVKPTTFGYAIEDELVVEDGGKVLKTLSLNDKFVVFAREGDKFRIELEDGTKGWVSADAVILEDVRTPLSPPSQPSITQRIVQTANAYRGARYRRGGTSAASGFDCSGFVQYVYRNHGIKLPRDSRSQFGVGTPVARANLQVGDMVFFAGTYRRGISHVGIYIGDNKFIHASTPRGGVRVDDLSNSYYARRYAGARRVIKQ